jgi:hypothetical protein
MIDWLLITFESALVALGLVALAFYFFKKKVSLTTLAIAGVTELLVISQLVLTILLASASQGYLELIGYAVAALLVPLGAAALASMDGTRVGNLVISLAPFVVAIMFARMWIIWIS